MAAVTADLTGVPGVVVLDGPAAPTALAAIERCRIDHSSVIFVSAPSSSRLPGRAALDAATKAVISLAPASAAHWIAHAVHLALGVPRGPVNLELDPMIASDLAVSIATSVRPSMGPSPDASALDEAARVLSAASRPVTLVGMYTRTDDIAGWVRAFAEATPAPVLCSPRAKGVLPDPHPLALGLLADNAVADTLVARADLVIAAGLDASEAAARRWSGTTPVLHLGPLPASDAPYRPRTEVVADVGLILEELAPRLRDRSRADWDVAELDRLKRLLPGSATHRAGGSFERVVAMTREATPPGTIATADGTLTTACARAWPAVAPHEFLAPSDTSVTGFAIPAAVAALLVRADRQAMCFTDGAGFTRSLPELDIAVRKGLEVVVIVMAEDDLDVEARAHAVGAIGFVARGDAALGWMLERALSSKTPAVIAVQPSGGEVRTPV